MYAALVKGHVTAAVTAAAALHICCVTIFVFVLFSLFCIFVYLKTLFFSASLHYFTFKPIFLLFSDKKIHIFSDKKKKFFFRTFLCVEPKYRER